MVLGALIRGATPHFDYIAAEVSKGLANTSMNTGVPITFGVLTTDTIEQAVERAGTKAGNKGAEAASAAIELVSLMGQLGLRSRHGSANERTRGSAPDAVRARGGATTPPTS